MNAKLFWLIHNERPYARYYYEPKEGLKSSFLYEIKNIRIYYSLLYAYHGIKNLITSNFQVREKVSLKWP